MSTITLRNYISEIERLLEQEAFEETIGHCRHILQHYPKNADTYRVLGRALLEKARFDEAEQVFPRVLSAVPRDFIAHIGMSSIAERLQQIDRAIWHMERAFEQRSTNAIVTDELRRLYGRRGEIIPDKIQLTRGALAKQYADSQMFDQAISELHQALVEQPTRLDLKTLLMEMLWNANHHVEAGETALEILRDMPDCIAANKLMARLWLLNKRPEDAKPFLERLEALAPYDSLEVIYRTLDPSAVVPDGSFILQRLDWSAEVASAMVDSSAPEWIDNIGDVFGGEDHAPAGTDNIPAEPLDVPDWVTSKETAPSDDLPDWFGSSQPAPKAENLPSAADWFSDIAQDIQHAQPEPPTPPPTAAPSDDLPDWFSELDAKPSPETSTEDSKPQTGDITDTSWLLDATPAEDEKRTTNMSISADWLASVTEETPTSTDEEQSSSDLDWLLDGDTEIVSDLKPSTPVFSESASWMDNIPEYNDGVTASGETEDIDSESSMDDPTGFTGLLAEIEAAEEQSAPDIELMASPSTIESELDAIVDSSDDDEDIDSLLDATRAPSPDEVAALLAAAYGEVDEEPAQFQESLLDDSAEVESEVPQLEMGTPFDDIDDQQAQTTPEWDTDSDSSIGEPDAIDEFAMLFEQEDNLATDDMLDTLDENEPSFEDAPLAEWSSDDSFDMQLDESDVDSFVSKQEINIESEGELDEYTDDDLSADWLTDVVEPIDASLELEENQSEFEVLGELSDQADDVIKSIEASEDASVEWLAQPSEMLEEVDELATEVLAEDEDTSGLVDVDKPEWLSEPSEIEDLATEGYSSESIVASESETADASLSWLPDVVEEVEETTLEVQPEETEEDESAWLSTSEFDEDGNVDGLELISAASDIDDDELFEVFGEPELETSSEQFDLADDDAADLSDLFGEPELESTSEQFDLADDDAADLSDLFGEPELETSSGQFDLADDAADLSDLFGEPELETSSDQFDLADDDAANLSDLFGEPELETSSDQFDLADDDAANLSDLFGEPELETSSDQFDLADDDAADLSDLFGEPELETSSGQFDLADDAADLSDLFGEPELETSSEQFDLADDDAADLSDLFGEPELETSSGQFDLADDAADLSDLFGEPELETSSDQFDLADDDAANLSDLFGEPELETSRDQFDLADDDAADLSDLFGEPELETSSGQFDLADDAADLSDLFGEPELETSSEQFDLADDDAADLPDLFAEPELESVSGQFDRADDDAADLSDLFGEPELETSSEQFDLADDDAADLADLFTEPELEPTSEQFDLADDDATDLADLFGEPELETSRDQFDLAVDEGKDTDLTDLFGEPELETIGGQSDLADDEVADLFGEPEPTEDQPSWLTDMQLDDTAGTDDAADLSDLFAEPELETTSGQFDLADDEVADLFGEPEPTEDQPSWLTDMQLDDTADTDDAADLSDLFAEPELEPTSEQFDLADDDAADLADLFGEPELEPTSEQFDLADDDAADLSDLFGEPELETSSEQFDLVDDDAADLADLFAEPEPAEDQPSWLTDMQLDDTADTDDAADLSDLFGEPELETSSGQFDLADDAADLSDLFGEPELETTSEQFDLADDDAADLPDLFAEPAEDQPSWLTDMQLDDTADTDDAADLYDLFGEPELETSSDQFDLADDDAADLSDLFGEPELETSSEQFDLVDDDAADLSDLFAEPEPAEDQPSWLTDMQLDDTADTDDAADLSDLFGEPELEPTSEQFDLADDDAADLSDLFGEPELETSSGQFDLAVDEGEDTDLADLFGEPELELETKQDIPDWLSNADLADESVSDDAVSDTDEPDVDELFATITSGGDTRDLIDDTELAPELEWMSSIGEDDIDQTSSQDTFDIQFSREETKPAETIDLGDLLSIDSATDKLIPRETTAYSDEDTDMQDVSSFDFDDDFDFDAEVTVPSSATEPFAGKPIGLPETLSEDFDNLDDLDDFDFSADTIQTDKVGTPTDVQGFGDFTFDKQPPWMRKLSGTSQPQHQEISVEEEAVDVADDDIDIDDLFDLDDDFDF